jgi:hypothetical protein
MYILKHLYLTHLALRGLESTRHVTAEKSESSQDDHGRH